MARGKLGKTLAGAGVLALLGLSGCGGVPDMKNAFTDYGPPFGKPTQILVYPFSEKAKKVFLNRKLGPDGNYLPLPSVHPEYVVLGPVREHLCQLRYYFNGPTDFPDGRHPGLQKKAMEKALKESRADALIRIRIHNKNADGPVGMVIQTVESCVDLTATAIRWR